MDQWQIWIQTLYNSIFWFWQLYYGYVRECLAFGKYWYMLKYLGIKVIDTLNELSNHIRKENCVCLCVCVCVCACVHMLVSLWVGKIPQRRERLPTPVFWPGEFHGLFSPWGRKHSDVTEWLSLHFIKSMIKQEMG